MKIHQPLKVVNQLINAELNGKIDKNDRCCGESGTLAVTRPDISTQVRFRKEAEMIAGVELLRSHRCRLHRQGLTEELCWSDQDSDILSRPVCRDCRDLKPIPEPPPTISLLSWRAISLVRTGWLTTWRRRIEGGIERVLV